MEIVSRTAGDVEILILEGRLDAYASEDAKGRICGLIDNGHTKIVLNLDAVEYVSSSGLRVMFTYLKKLRDVGGDLKLACLKPYVREVFDIAGFTELFDISEREEEAVRKFEGL